MLSEYTLRNPDLWPVFKSAMAGSHPVVALQYRAIRSRRWAGSSVRRLSVLPFPPMMDHSRVELGTTYSIQYPYNIFCSDRLYFQSHLAVMNKKPEGHLERRRDETYLASRIWNTVLSFITVGTAQQCHHLAEYLRRVRLDVGLTGHSLQD